MSKFKNFLRLNLQLFGDNAGTGGASGTGAEGTQAVTVAPATPQTKGAKNNPLSDVKYGTQIEENNIPTSGEENKVNTPDRNAEFDKLIKGEYKDLYDARVQEIIQKRLKSTKETVEKYNSLTPMLEMLARKYGVDASDTEALSKAIEEDDSYYEEEALEKGVTVEQLKNYKKMERENAEFKRQMEEKKRQDKAEKMYATWMEQAEKAKQTFPSLNLEVESQNPQFRDLLLKGIDVGNAYYLVHKDDIIPAAMQYTAKAVEQKVVNKVIANGTRPVENGLNSQSSAQVKSDVSQLSRADIAEINRRVARGDKISFTNYYK